MENFFTPSSSLINGEEDQQLCVGRVRKPSTTRMADTARWENEKLIWDWSSVKSVRPRAVACDGWHGGALLGEDI